MHELKQTIEQARAKGLDDAAIKNLLVKAGWDEDLAQAGLQGVFIPAPPVKAAVEAAEGQPAVATKEPARGLQLSALEAAVHHVLLWFFTGSLTFTIAFVAATLFGSEQSISAVSTFLATSVITLIPYGYFYLRYLRKLRQDPAYTTGRVWSIITIVLHSIGALAALITLVAVAINTPEEGLPVFVAAAMIAALDTLVVAAYAHATFVDGASPRRKAILKIFPVIITAMLLLLIVLSVGKVGPLRADEQTRQDLVKAAGQVRDYTKSNQELPASAADAGLAAGVEYRRIKADTYELCASFKTGQGDSYSSEYPRGDSYVSDYDFSNDKSGRQCFELESSFIKDKQLDDTTSPAIINGMPR